MNNINKTIAALFMAATFLPMSAQTPAKKECCKQKTECSKKECCKTGCEKMKERMDKLASDDVSFATRQYTLMLDQVRFTTHVQSTSLATSFVFLSTTGVQASSLATFGSFTSLPTTSSGQYRQSVSPSVLTLYSILSGTTT